LASFLAATLIGLGGALAFHSHFIIGLEIGKYFLEEGSFLGILAPALVIHLWLPLFAISSLIVKLIYPIFRAVEWAQWFLKQGDAHPLKDIGRASAQGHRHRRNHHSLWKRNARQRSLDGAVSPGRSLGA
jgi:hypothetical protein